MNYEESLLITIVVSVSVAMLIGSYNYNPDARYAPQIAAVATLLFATVVLINKMNVISLGGKTDLIGKTNNTAASIAKESNDGNESISDVAGSGEFRIDLPVIQYTIPKTEYQITPRIVLTLLLLIYFATLWLAGIFVATVTFLLLFKITIGIGDEALVPTIVFTLAILLVFGFYLETPLFRPEHDLFDLGIQL